jgi:hypothetical protein
MYHCGYLLWVLLCFGVSLFLRPRQEEKKSSCFNSYDYLGILNPYLLVQTYLCINKGCVPEMITVRLQTLINKCMCPFSEFLIICFFLHSFYALLKPLLHNFLLAGMSAKRVCVCFKFQHILHSTNPQ